MEFLKNILKTFIKGLFALGIFMSITPTPFLAFGIAVLIIETAYKKTYKKSWIDKVFNW